MATLAARIRQTTAPALQAKKEGWAQRIEAKAAPQEQAAAALKAAEAQLTVAKGILRAVADVVQVALVRLKRDLKNIGLTETQIHDIIPDYVSTPRKTGNDKPATGKPATPPAPATPAPAPATPDPKP